MNLGTLNLEVEDTKQILPDAEGVFDAIARIGYQFEHAVADIVDNSIDARATEVLIRFFYDRDAVNSVAVIDNGHGMTATKIDRAMSFGARTGKDESALGKYGMGLKAASFSQCDVLTVISRHNGVVASRRWTKENVQRDWVCETITQAAAERYLSANAGRIATTQQGTLVQWDRLDVLSHAAEPPSKTIESRFAQLHHHLGLVFHRFLESGKVKITLDSVNSSTRLHGFPQQVKPLNPFPRREALHGYPLRFGFEYPGIGQISFLAHIWRRNAPDAGFRLSGGRNIKRQGFYVYRNDRLIQPGGWNGLRSDTEVHTSLARVELDIPPRLDSHFKPTVQKSSVSIPEPFLRRIRDEARAGNKTFTGFLSDAETVHREKPNAKRRIGLIPTDGVSKVLQHKFERILGAPDDEADTVAFLWGPLPEEEFFRIDQEANAILLNSLYRGAVLNGLRGSAADAPLVKTLLMLLCKDDMGRVNRVRKYETRLKTYNALLVEAVRSQW